MSENLSVLRYQGDALYCYSAGAAADPESLSAPGVVERLQRLLSERRQELVFAAPGEDVRLLAMEIAPDEKKHLQRSLPYMVEEQVAEDVDELHVAYQLRQGHSLTAMLVRRERMLDWQSALSDLAALTQWTPEPLLLPWRDEEWCLLLEGDRALLRHAEGEGTAVEREMLPSLLAALLADRGPPRSLVLYGTDQTEDTALLPETLQDRVQWRRGGFATALWLDQQPEVRANLRQGEFAPRLPLQRWWQQWQRVAVVLLAAVLLHLAAVWADYLRLAETNLDLRTAVQERYREAYPRGAVVDAEKQLQRQLASLKGAGQGAGFVTLLTAVGSVLAAQQGTTIDSLNYTERGGEMRISITAPDFAAVERARAGLSAAGIVAVMENSTNNGGSVRARLRVGRNG